MVAAPVDGSATDRSPSRPPLARLGTMPLLPRRSFLGALGAALLGARRPARAQAGPVARRLVVFFSPNGTTHRYWRPTPTAGGGFSFPAGSILEPLAPVARELVVIDGLDFKGVSNHEGGMAAMLTGGGGAGTETGGASVDQYVARRLSGATRFDSLELGVHTSAWGGNTQTRMAYRRAGEFAPPDDDPASVYRRAFGGAEPGEADALLARRRSVLDVNRGELLALQRRLGTTERPKLEAHLESLRRMEASLSGSPAPGGAGCRTPTATPLDPRRNDGFPEVGRAQTELMLAALACDLTRVASIQWSHTVSPTVFSWLGLDEGHHALSHIRDENVDGIRQFVAAERWFAGEFAHLVARLAELPEPGGEGSMLDHSLVVWAKEMGDARLHECVGVPFVLAGRAGGHLTPGRLIQPVGEPHQKLLVSICHALGLDNQTFGSPEHGTGPLAGVRA
jgi:hypothetical protein